jgi:hypothetical protein
MSITLNLQPPLLDWATKKDALSSTSRARLSIFQFPLICKSLKYLIGYLSKMQTVKYLAYKVGRPVPGFKYVGKIKFKQ